jgi:hydroxymethylpyrimidine pyrophosphatase-like HAD family hydrolase
VNKATGLSVVLKEMRIDPEAVVAIGDAENDHAFLSMCGLGVAVDNALPMLKERADVVTQGARGAGVIELIDRILSTDLAEIPSRPKIATTQIAT